MPRQLVVCLDGTGNRFSHTNTNVIRVLRSLSTDLTQVVPFYDPGVGTFGLKEATFQFQKLPAKVLGLALGWGFDCVVEAGYNFLARNYQPGDQIFLFGFSRGSYAVRSLAALIHAVGLAEPWQTNLFEYAWAMLHARVKAPGDKTAGAPDFSLQAQFRSTFGRTVPIHFAGVFDTVSTVGWIYEPLVVPYSRNNASVAHLRHAVSIDERRCFFRQNLWGTPWGLDPKGTDVKEVWFAGVHSDIGGGYGVSQDSLALLTFRWMIGEARAQGLNVDPALYQAQLNPSAPDTSRPDPNACQHDSMNKWWKIAEWIPSRAWNKNLGVRKFRMGAMPPIHQPYPRHIDPGIHIHRSVETRLAGPTNYRPINLPAPPNYLIADDDPLATPSTKV